MEQRAKNRGFTLMELLVVIALLGFLIAMGMASFQSSQKKSRDARRKSDLRQIMVALEAYYNDRGRYPAASSGAIVGCGDIAAPVACTWNGAFTLTSGANTITYMVTLPKDPTSGRKYVYVAATANEYKLYAMLENSEDADIHAGGYSSTCDTGDTTPCNYGISSTNTTP